MTDYYINKQTAGSAELWAATLGERLDSLRLEANLTQKQVAESLGITEKTYRNIIKGKGKWVHVIAVLQLLKRKDLVEQMIPEVPYSPMELLKLQGKKRQRASGEHIKENHTTYHKDEELDW